MIQIRPLVDPLHSPFNDAKKFACCLQHTALLLVAQWLKGKILFLLLAIITFCWSEQSAGASNQRYGH
jgi:hypothetical protein